MNAFTSSAITLLLSTGRTTCPTFHGHYRMGFRANNIELLRRSSSESPAVVGSGRLGVQILPFRLVP